MTWTTLLDIGLDAGRTIGLIALALAAVEILLGISAGRKP